MDLHIQQIAEPQLEFGNGVVGSEPKVTLSDAGPFSSSIQGDEILTIRLGVVGPRSEVQAVRAWVSRLDRFLHSNESNSRRFRDFPGTRKALRCRFEIPDHFVRELHYQDVLVGSSSQQHREAFDRCLKAYKDAIGSLFLDRHPDCILVCFSEDLASLRVENPALSALERDVLERLREEDESGQLTLFEPSAEDRRVAAELLPQAEELLFRNFHRALKASCMMELNAVPLQVVRRHTYINAEAKQSEATRAWNLAVALYYKSGNIPWRPAEVPNGTCFVGISFHHLKRRSGHLVYASVAQAFSSEMEPFALKGATIPHEQRRDRNPYLTGDQASSLMVSIVKEYTRRTGSAPLRVVVHKTSRYQPEEQEGFDDTKESGVSSCHLVWLAPTGFRLLRRGTREPERGMFCSLGGNQHYLFTTGYVPAWEEYPGPHIPAPLQIGVCDDSPIIDRAREVLALTKMNWNGADGLGRIPITVQFARRVGIIMTEMPEDVTPNPLYRFYM